MSFEESFRLLNFCAFVPGAKYCYVLLVSIAIVPALPGLKQYPVSRPLNVLLTCSVVLIVIAKLCAPLLKFKIIAQRFVRFGCNFLLKST